MQLYVCHCLCAALFCHGYLCATVSTIGPRLIAFKRQQERDSGPCLCATASASRLPACRRLRATAFVPLLRVCQTPACHCLRIAANMPLPVTAFVPPPVYHRLGATAWAPPLVYHRLGVTACVPLPCVPLPVCHSLRVTAALRPRRCATAGMPTMHPFPTPLKTRLCINNSLMVTPAFGGPDPFHPNRYHDNLNTLLQRLPQRSKLENSRHTLVTQTAGGCQTRTSGGDLHAIGSNGKSGCK